MRKKSKRIIVSLAVLLGLTGLGMGVTHNNIHADDPMYAPNYMDNNSYGSTAGQYVKDYSGTQPHDNEATDFTNHEYSGPTSNEMSSPVSQNVIDHTKDPVDLLLVFYYYDKTAPSDTSQFCDAQHNIYNKGDTVDINGLFTSIGHGHGYGYAESSDPVVGHYSDFVINDNKTMYVPVQGVQDVATIDLSLSNGLTEEVSKLIPGQQFNITQYLQGQGYTDANSNDVITVPSHFYDNSTFPVTLASSNNDSSDDSNTNTDNSSNGTMTANISFIENGNDVKDVFANVDSNSTVNLSDIAKKYGYKPVSNNDVVSTPYSPYDSASYNIDVLAPDSEANDNSGKNDSDDNTLPGNPNSSNDSIADIDDDIINDSYDVPHHSKAKKHINRKPKRIVSKKHIKRYKERKNVKRQRRINRKRVYIKHTKHSKTRKNAKYQRHVMRHRVNRSISYYSAKKAVQRAYNGKDSLRDKFSMNGRYFGLHPEGKRGKTLKLKSTFGAEATIHFAITKVGNRLRIHTSIRTNRGWANKRYYRYYGIRRNVTVRI